MSKLTELVGFRLIKLPDWKSFVDLSKHLDRSPSYTGSREYSSAQNQPPKILLFKAPAVFGQLSIEDKPAALPGLRYI